MTYWHAIIYGIIQGLGEFLPISSSAHLALFPYFGNFPDPGPLFDLCLHLGTSLSVIVYFHKELLELFRFLPQAITAKSSFELTGTARLCRHLILSLACTGVGLVLLLPLHKMYGRNVFLIAFCLSFFGIVLYLVDKFSESQGKTFESGISFKTSMFIGFSQAMAIFPGVSRSGITISMARFLGVSRDQATRFSFLLSLPLILVGAVAEIPAIVKNPVFTAEIFSYMLIGIGTSFLTGYLTISMFLKFLQKISFVHFMIYRIFLAILIFSYN